MTWPMGHPHPYETTPNFKLAPLTGDPITDKENERFMRVLVIGATGAIGSRLLPQLRAAGHEVIGTSRSADKAKRLPALGADGVVLDVLDAAAVNKAVAATRPEAIIYEPTALADVTDLRHFDRSFAATSRLRTKGADHVIAAARQYEVPRLIAQSYACHRYARVGDPIKSEDDPLDPSPAAREAMGALAYLDNAVTAAGGIALRYGSFYGQPDDPLVAAVQARKFPIIGDGAGVWSFVHLDDAAAATVLALNQRGPAIYNIVDDEPAATSVWLTALAKIVGAKPPLHIPRPMGRLLAGDVLVSFATESRGASNAKAKRELDWSLRYPSWRQGFAVSYGPATSQQAAA
ncbi:MAG TPA: NAD(P)-dependent oxidoreductase [Chloroflexota bacterium]|nr:NAD(P)-dependent oxidoreductase [Chloroflexota bacterium]